MPPTLLPDLRLNAEILGPKDGYPVVLLHALGLNLAVWNKVVPLLPSTCRIMALDMRGHGASDVPPAPYTMGALIHDAERMMEHHGFLDAVVIGSSIGGMIAQGLAAKRLDLVRGMVLSNTAARIGTPGQWHTRIEGVRKDGLASLVDPTLERWLGRGWREAASMPALRAMFMASQPEGWCGAAAAIAGTDFYTTTAALALPTLAIAGANDGSTPPDLVRETADLIKGSRFALMKGAGHIPMAEKPAEFADLLCEFLTGIGHA